MPRRATTLQNRIANGMRFGNRPFQFAARSGPLYGRFAFLWVGSIPLVLVGSAIIGLAGFLQMGIDPQSGAVPGEPSTPLAVVAILVVLAMCVTFGVMIAWYQAATINHFAAHTSYEGASFRGNATPWRLIWLVISNLLIVSLTLGLLAPVARARARPATWWSG